LNGAARGLTIMQNWFYGNTGTPGGNALNLTVGGNLPNDLPTGDSVGVNPGFASTSNENYSISAAAEDFIAAYLRNSGSGFVSPTSYLSAGAVQPQALLPSYVIAPTINRFFTEEGLS